MRASSPQLFLVQCSGIPGCGKSSALRRLQHTGMLQLLLEKECRVEYVQEPVELWRVHGWLEKFYSDPDRYAFAFQTLVFATHVEAVEAAMKNVPYDARPTVLIVERSMWDQKLFWQLQVDLNRTTSDAMHNDAYNSIWSKWRRFVPEPSLIVLFQTSSIQVTMRRLQARGRREETGGASSSSSESEHGRNLLLSSMCEEPTTIDHVGGLTATYQELLAKKHREWFAAPLARPEGEQGPSIPCRHINVDAPYHVSDGSLAELAMELAEAIRGIL